MSLHFGLRPATALQLGGEGALASDSVDSVASVASFPVQHAKLQSVLCARLMYHAWQILEDVDAAGETVHVAYVGLRAVVLSCMPYEPQDCVVRAAPLHPGPAASGR